MFFQLGAGQTFAVVSLAFAAPVVALAVALAVAYNVQPVAAHAVVHQSHVAHAVQLVQVVAATANAAACVICPVQTVVRIAAQVVVATVFQIVVQTVVAANVRIFRASVNPAAVSSLLSKSVKR